jgi:hypothetical protein
MTGLQHNGRLIDQKPHNTLNSCRLNHHFSFHFFQLKFQLRSTETQNPKYCHAEAYQLHCAVFTKPRKTERKRKSNILVITVKTVSDRYNAHRWCPKTRNTQVTQLSFPTHCYTEKNACAGVFCTKIIINQIPIMYQSTNLERASLPSVPTDVQGRRSGTVPRLHPSSSRRVLKSSSSTLLSRLRSLIEPPCGLHGWPVE